MDLDKKIYNEYLNGNNGAFEILYNKYKDKIQYFIFNIIKDYEKAEDIMQEVFIYIMNNKCRDDISFKYYIYLIAKSRAFSYLNIKNRRNEIVKQYLSNEELKSDTDLLKIIIEQENKKELLDAINKLDEKYKNVMYLVKIEELSYKQTAEILDETPQNIKNIVYRGKKELKKFLIKNKFVETNKFSKVLGIILCIGILLSGVVFAQEIKNFIYELKTNIFGNTNEGISAAVENNYITDVNMDFISVKDAQLKIEQLLLDDFNLGVVINIKLNENIDNIYKITFKNILIIDENNNILYANYEDIDKFEEYCKKNNLDMGKYNQGFSDGSYTGRILKKENNNLTFSFSTSSDKFPNSNSLYIKLDTIYCDYKDTQNRKKFEGTFETNIDLKNMSNIRKSINYVVKNINDDKTTVTRAQLSMANMKLELITESNKIDFNKLQKRYSKNFNVIEMIPFHEMYLETMDNKKYFQTNTGGNGYTTLENNKIKYYVTFNYTYFNKTENIKIVLPTNKKEQIIIELEYKNDEAQ